MVEREPEKGESILQRWVGSWVELHYAASSAEVTPHGELIPGPPETRLGTCRLEAIGERGIEAFIPDPEERRTLFIPWNSVLLVRGPSRPEMEREESRITEESDSPHNRQELMEQLTSAQTPSEIAEARAVAESWMASHPSDGDVRAAYDQLKSQHSEDTDLEAGSPT
jgi:hypothetical protein